MPSDERLTSRALHLPPVDAEVKLRHELTDMSGRARLGGFFYVVGLVTLGLASQVPARYPSVFIVATVLFVVLALLRLRKPPTHLDGRGARSWIKQLWVIVWLSTALWGMGAAWVVVTTDIETARILALLLIGAFGTALTHTYPMRFGRGALGLALLFLPQLVVLVAEPDSAMLGVALSIYFFYLLLVLRRSHIEYWGRVALEEDTRNQRDFYEQQSRRDGLTGLPNRRRFDAVLAAALGRRRSDAVSLVLLDLDHFKAINDRFGHVVGDRCLMHFAGLLSDRFTTVKELPARIGGEEFAVVLSGCGLAEATLHAEGIRQTLASSELLHEGKRITLTVSGGVVAAHPGESADALFARADAALYEAKRSGRSRVVATECVMPIVGDMPLARPL